MPTSRNSQSPAITAQKSSIFCWPKKLCEIIKTKLFSFDVSGYINGISEKGYKLWGVVEEFKTIRDTNSSPKMYTFNIRPFISINIFCSQTRLCIFKRLYDVLQICITNTIKFS